MGKKSKHAEPANEDKSCENNSEERELTYEEKLEDVTGIAKPIATRKLSKKLYKLIKKASSNKSVIYDLKGVQKRLKKAERGLVVFGGDVTPIDLICHLPIVCEENDVPYIFTPSKEDIGTAMGIRRSAMVVMVQKSKEYQELYDECVNEVKSID